MRDLRRVDRLLGSGDRPVPRRRACGPPDPRLRSWFEAYRGRGRGEVNLDAFPEPYVGALDRRPAGVFLGSTSARRTWSSGTLGAVRRRDPPPRQLLGVGGDLAIPAGPLGGNEGPQRYLRSAGPFCGAGPGSQP